MKKKLGKLVLHRETLRALESSLHRVVGADPNTGPGDCTTIIATDCDGESRDCTGAPTILNTCRACSNGCATGGACTVTCGAPGFCM